jgi:hypothetical protein
MLEALRRLRIIGPSRAGRIASAMALALAVPALVAVPGLRATAALSGSASGASLPAHLYAPYFETWTNDRISTIADQSGARFFTLAFIQTPRAGSCVPTWNSDPSQPVSGGRYVDDVAKLRAMGGDVVPSFGGYTADHLGLELADSCRDVGKIVSGYKAVIQTLGVKRLDMDIEDRSLRNQAGIQRRSEAIAMLEQWAEQKGIQLEIQYTLPVSPTGLEQDAVSVIGDAIGAGASVDVVNVMAFDYYDGTTDMGAAAVSAANGAHDQLGTLYPDRSSGELWRMLGVTLLPGIDDYPKKTEVTHLPDARRVLQLAQRHRFDLLSIWAIQRDNGDCPGKRDKNDCSGIEQKRWAFSRLLERFS